MEKIVAVIEDESRGPPAMKGIGSGGIAIRVGSEKARYDLFFTDKRIIAAVVFSTSDLSILMGIGGLQSIKWKKKRDERRAEFKGKTPEEILKLHPESCEVPYGSIESIKVKKGMFGAKMEIEAVWKGKTEKFDLPIPKKRSEEVERILALYLPSKVR